MASTRSRLARLARPLLGPRLTAVARAREADLRRLVQARRQAGQERRQAAQEAAVSADLTALAVRFGTDKWGDHRYTPHYQRHLEHLRDRPVTLLEIGIGGYSRAGDGGASLRMWKQFFPHGRIYGLDLHDKSFVDEPRIKAFRGSQADPEVLRAIVDEIGRPDVVIDDGSHRSEHVIASFEVLFPLLADDGIYVVEDTQTSYWPRYGGDLDPAADGTSLAMLKRLTDGLNHEELLDPDHRPSYTDLHVVGMHWYHNLVFVQKGVNQEGSPAKEALLRTLAAEAAAAGKPDQGSGPEQPEPPQVIDLRDPAPDRVRSDQP
jgi:hypothetical protein